MPGKSGLHEGHELFDAFDGHGVVDRGAHAADGPVALEVDKARRSRRLDKGRVLVRVAGDKGHVHEGAVARAHRVVEERALVQVVVEDLRLLHVALFHLCNAALLQQVVERQPRHVDAVGRRRVVHAALVGHDFVVQHRGRDVQRVAEQVVPDDDDGHARRADVLLRAGKGDAELGDVVLLREDAGGQVRHQRHAAGLRQPGVARAVDRVVAADVEVVRVAAELRLVPVRDLRIADVLGGGNLLDVRVLLGLLDGQVGEVAGVDVVRLAGLVAGQQVQRHLRELHGRAALQEEHLVVLGDAHERAQVRLGLCDDLLIHLGAVAHLHDGHAGVAVANQLLLRPLQHGQGQHRGAG